nr:MAG TPA: baseplate protein [Caudoviricetes sp.]
MLDVKVECNQTASPKEIQNFVADIDTEVLVGFMAGRQHVPTLHKADTEKPNDAKYAAGFIPSDVLPAEWLNWFLSGATKGVTALNTGVKSIEQEINAVLASRAVTPDITATNQLLTVLNKIKAEAVLAAHPVGSLYWTSKNENPAVTFGGGTWKQITDKFVLAAGSTYKAESTGGAPTVTLTVANLPSHSHTFTPSGTIKSTFTGSKHSHTFTPSGRISGGAYKFTGSKGTTSLDGEHSHTFTAPKTPENKLNPSSGSPAVRGSTTLSTSYDGKHAHTFTPTGSISVTTNPSFSGTAGTTGSTTQGGTVSSSFTGNSGNTGSVGSGSRISIMPPYVVKYCWERTA